MPPAREIRISFRIDNDADGHPHGGICRPATQREDLYNLQWPERSSSSISPHGGGWRPVARGRRSSVRHWRPLPSRVPRAFSVLCCRWPSAWCFPVRHRFRSPSASRSSEPREPASEPPWAVPWHTEAASWSSGCVRRLCRVASGHRVTASRLVRVDRPALQWATRSDQVDGTRRWGSPYTNRGMTPPTVPTW